MCDLVCVYLNSLAWNNDLFSFFHLFFIIPIGLSLLKTSARAENLTASFSVQQGNVTALFSWSVAPAQPPMQVDGFQVTWTETMSDSRKNGLPNSLVSQSQILPPVRVLVDSTSCAVSVCYIL